MKIHPRDRIPTPMRDGFVLRFEIIARAVASFTARPTVLPAEDYRPLYCVSPPRVARRDRTWTTKPNAVPFQLSYDARSVEADSPIVLEVCV